MDARTKQLNLFDFLVAPEPANFSTTELADAFRTLLPENAALLDALLSEFDLMEIAEDEIIKAQGRHPAAAELIKACFLPLKPEGWIREAPEQIYRAHCAELLDRVALGLPLAEATNCELMWIFKECSLIAPLNNDATGLYLHIFRQTFGDAFLTDGKLEDLNVYIKESYKGAWEELLIPLRRRAFSTWRKNAWDTDHKKRGKHGER